MSACRELTLLCSDSSYYNQKEMNITIMSNENHYPYYRPSLSKFCKPGEPLDITKHYLQKSDWFKINNINLLLSTPVSAVDFKAKTVRTKTNEIYYYDKLIISSGSKSFKLPNIDYNQPGIFSLINYEDIKKIISYINKNKIKNALVIGGGILGCESANFLHSYKIKTTIIEMQKQIMPALLTQSSALYMQTLLEKKGVNIILDSLVKRIIYDESSNSLNVFRVNHNSAIKYDLVIINVGVRGNHNFLKNNEIKIHLGIQCNEKQETSVPDVFAAGDVAEIDRAKSFLLWEPAIIQGRNAARNILVPNSPLIFDRTQRFITNYSSFGDINLCTFGDKHDIKENNELFIIENKKNISFQKTFVHYDSKTKKIIFIASFNDQKVKKLISHLKSSSNQITVDNFKEL